MIISVRGEVTGDFVFNTNHLVIAEYVKKKNIYRLTFEVGGERIERTASKKVFHDVVEQLKKLTR